MKIATISTANDPGNVGWRITDEVIQLRPVGREDPFELRVTSSGDPLIGSSSACAVRVQDATGCVSRLHARLARGEGALWSVHDLGSKNGTWVEGARRITYPLTPGTEIVVGSVSLIAESRELIALRQLLSRMLGYSDEKRVDVDRALRGVRDAATLRAALVLCGPGDLLAIAARLHEEMLGGDAPFVPVDSDGPALPLMAKAANGTLCLSVKQLPADLENVIAATRVPGSRTRVIICAPTIKAAAKTCLMFGRVARVVLTPVATRRDELAVLVEDCARDAADRLGQASTGLDDRDRAWLRKRRYEGFAELDEFVRRMVAIRTLGVTEGAARLGMTHSALSHWARRHAIPT